MHPVSFEEAVEQIVARDPRYDADAYRFLREALDYTVTLFEKPTQGPSRHVTGQELLEGVRHFALREYGQMALRVLAHWGVRRSEDVGEIVFNLVEAGVLGRTERDRREDFSDGYEFEEAFRRPFRPARAARPEPRRRKPADPRPAATEERSHDG